MEATSITVRTRIDLTTARDNSRFAISGVQVRPHADPGMVWLTATDGFKLACVPADATGPRDIPDHMPRGIIPTTKKGGSVVRNGQWQSGKKFLPLTPPDEVTNFPTCSDALPELSATSSGVVTVGINAKLLHDLAASLGSETVYLVLDIERDTNKAGTGINKAIRVLPAREDAPASLGVLMPIKVLGDPPATWRDRRAAYCADHPAR